MSKLWRSLYILLIIIPPDLLASTQENEEKLPEYQMEEIVVVSDRNNRSLFESTGDTSVLTSSTLEKLPADNLAETLEFIPGLTFIDRGGSGTIPIAISRGSFGGGETEYLRVFMDGSPVNDMRTGLVESSQIPISSIDRIEVSRGGASSLYGDAAIGAVINIITRHHDENKFAMSLKSGDDGYFSADVNSYINQDNQNAKLLVQGDRIEGYRAHSDKENISFSGQYKYLLSSGSEISAITNIRNLRQSIPGPLTPEQINTDPEQNNILFNQDYRHRNVSEIVIKFRKPEKIKLSFYRILDSGMKKRFKQRPSV